MTGEFTFVMHHVGARGGSCGFTMPAPFQADALDVLYEADPACIGEIAETMSASGLRTVSLPYAIGARLEQRLFHLHVNPYTNSFQKLNPKYASFYEFQAGYDYIVGDVTRDLKQIELDVRTIDHVAGDAGRPIPAPDFLLVDTEGTDYDVLVGARESLRTRGLMVSVEAQFQPIWQNQHLFGDICRLLDELGFDLASVYPHPGLSPHRTPVGLRGRIFHTSCDAVFLRRSDALAVATPDVDTLWVKTRKLAFGALLLGHVAYGIKALAAAREIPSSPEIRAAARAVSYMRFLDDVEGTISRTPARFPPLFTGVAAGRNRPVGRHVERYVRIKAALAPYPRLVSAIQTMLRRYRRLNSEARKRLGALRQRTPPPPQDTEFERLLSSYGIADVADLVRTTRLAEEPFARNIEPSA